MKLRISLKRKYDKLKENKHTNEAAPDASISFSYTRNIPGIRYHTKIEMGTMERGGNKGVKGVHFTFLSFVSKSKECVKIISSGRMPGREAQHSWKCPEVHGLYRLTHLKLHPLSPQSPS